jgi:hypothetical protein
MCDINLQYHMERVQMSEIKNLNQNICHEKFVNPKVLD